MQTLARQYGKCDFYAAVHRIRLGTVVRFVVLALLTTVGAAMLPASGYADEAEFDFFSDEPIAEEQLILVPPPKPAWMTVGGPLALLAFFIGVCWLVKWLIPFKQTASAFDLHDLPTAAQRGIGMAAVLFGIALMFGAVEAHYQINLHGGALAYFQQMGPGKLIAFTHAHLFGFTTSFIIIGIPFSLHFSRLRVYQVIFPIGLVASLTDIISWWGIKYVSGNFEYITWGCGAIFFMCYMWMLIGLVRVLFFPGVKWWPDFISEDHQRRWEEKQPPS